jgi:hypothetical protein
MPLPLPIALLVGPDVLAALKVRRPRRVRRVERAQLASAGLY